MKLRIFLMADAAFCAIPGPATPDGYYNIERMVKLLVLKGAKVKICGTCVKARGLQDIDLIEGTETGIMAELTNWVVNSDKIITFWADPQFHSFRLIFVRIPGIYML